MGTMNAVDSKRWFTLAQAAVYTGLSDETIRRFTKAGRLTPHRPAGLRPVLYDRQELDELVQASAEPLPAA